MRKQLHNRIFRKVICKVAKKSSNKKHKITNTDLAEDGTVTEVTIVENKANVTLASKDDKTTSRSNISQGNLLYRFNTAHNTITIMCLQLT